MDRNIIIEKVAAGLRRMETSPDYFVFWNDDDDEWTWDEETILGIPVLHSPFPLMFQPYSNTNCLFIPVFKTEPVEDETYQFGRGYYEG